MCSTTVLPVSSNKSHSNGSEQLVLRKMYHKNLSWFMKSELSRLWTHANSAPFFALQRWCTSTTNPLSSNCIHLDWCGRMLVSWWGEHGEAKHSTSGGFFVPAVFSASSMPALCSDSRSFKDCSFRSYSLRSNSTSFFRLSDSTTRVSVSAAIDR